MTVATRVLDLFSAVIIVIAGIYVEIRFAHLFSDVAKLAVAVTVLLYVTMQARRIIFPLIRQVKHADEATHTR